MSSLSGDMILPRWIMDIADMDYARMPQTVQHLAASFKLGISSHLRAFHKMFGLMSAISSVIPLGLLHMQPLQYWLKELHQSCGPLEVSSPVSIVRPIGIDLRKEGGQIRSLQLLVGELCIKEDRRSDPGQTWSNIFTSPALKTFLPALRGLLLVILDNMMAVAFINQQGGQTPFRVWLDVSFYGHNAN